MATQLLTDIDGVLDLIMYFESFLTTEDGDKFARFIDLLQVIFPEAEYEMPDPLAAGDVIHPGPAGRLWATRSSSSGTASDTAMKGKHVNYSEKMAFDAGTRQGADAAVKRIQEIAQAERDTRPIVGELPAQTSAAAIYRIALDMMGHDVKGVVDGALKDVWKHVRHQPVRRVAMDAAASSDLEKLLGPGVNSLKRR
jgi:hypothetical protein